MADEAGTRTSRRRCTALTLTALLLAPSTAAADRLRTIDVATGKSAILASSPNLEWLDRPCWAPDGRVIALEYRSTRHALQRRYVAYRSLGSREVLGRTSRYVDHAQLAPGCARVAEQRRRMPGGRPGLVVREIAGAPLTVFSGPSDLSGVAWSPDGALLAGYGSPTGLGGALRVVEAHGGREVARVEVGLGFVDVDPAAFAPDGRRLAVVIGDARADDADPAVVDVASGAWRGFAGWFEAEVAAWSPRGDRIAATQYDQIHLLDPDDGRDLGVVAPGARVDRLAWSPDGTQIAFTTFRRTGTTHYVVPAEPGARHRALLTTPALSATPLAWSPDGTRLVVGGG